MVDQNTSILFGLRGKQLAAQLKNNGGLSPEALTQAQSNIDTFQQQRIDEVANDEDPSDENHYGEFLEQLR